jgi:hypothetical protein
MQNTTVLYADESAGICCILSETLHGQQGATNPSFQGDHGRHRQVPSDTIISGLYLYVYAHLIFQLTHSLKRSDPPNISRHAVGSANCLGRT